MWTVRGSSNFVFLIPTLESFRVGKHLLLCVALLFVTSNSTSAFSLGSIFGYSSYEECILDKMDGVTNDLAASQITKACRELTKETAKTVAPDEGPKSRAYMTVLTEEWVPWIGGMHSYRILLRNDTGKTVEVPRMWGQVGNCTLPEDQLPVMSGGRVHGAQILPGETAYVDFEGLDQRTQGQPFCYRVGIEFSEP